MPWWHFWQQYCRLGAECLRRLSPAPTQIGAFVELLGCDASSNKAVAPMQAADLAAVCGSSAEAQAVAQAVYAYRKKWWLRFDGKTTA